MRAPGFARQVADRLVLELDGRRVELVPLEHAVREQAGDGGLDTLRFDAVFAAPVGVEGRSLSFRDSNFERRLGWKEIVVGASDGARIVSSDVPTASVSDALRSYPEDLLSSPPDVISARIEYEPGVGSGTAPTLVAQPVEEAVHWRLRIADRPRRARHRRDPRLAARGDVLGRGARAHARARKGDRGRLPRRVAGQAAPRCPARADRDGDAHRRGVRARPRDPPALPLHRPGAALSLAHRRLGPARRRGRGERLRPPRASRARACGRSQAQPSPPPRPP